MISKRPTLSPPLVLVGIWVLNMARIIRNQVESYPYGSTAKHFEEPELNYGPIHGGYQVDEIGLSMSPGELMESSINELVHRMYLPEEKESSEEEGLKTRSGKTRKTNRVVINPAGNLNYSIWPNQTLKWRFSRGISQNTKFFIRTAMTAIEVVSCVRFKEVQNSSHYVVFRTRRNGSCTTGGIGMPSERILEINFENYRVCPAGVMIHHLLHALGVFHEDARTDRDYYIRLHPEVIQTDKLDHYCTAQSDSSQTFGAFYDMDSIMHSSNTTFVVNNTKNYTTFEVKRFSPFDTNVTQIGQRYFLSKMDQYKLNRLYNCCYIGRPVPANEALPLNRRRRSLPSHGPSSFARLKLSLCKAICVQEQKFAELSQLQEPLKQSFKFVVGHKKGADLYKVVWTKCRNSECLKFAIQRVSEVKNGQKESKSRMQGTTPGEAAKHRLWERGLVYYQFHSDVNATERNDVLLAMETIEQDSCIQFQPGIGPEGNHVFIRMDREGCWAELNETSNGTQTVFNGNQDYCHNLKTYVVLLLEIVGLEYPIHRPDRDRYLKIDYQNMDPWAQVYLKTFNITNNVGGYEYYSSPFDYYSIMHRHEFTFSNNGRRTIRPTFHNLPPGFRLGLAATLSEQDKFKLLRMYKCCPKMRHA